MFNRLRAAATGLAILAATATPALSQGTLRIGMTAADIPQTTGQPDQGFEGFRFAGYTIYDALVNWDLSKADTIADIRPGLAVSWAPVEGEPTKWIFNLRKGVKFHDGTDFNADAVIWNLERIFNKDSPQFEANSAGIMRSRVPILASGYKKIDDYTVARTHDDRRRLAISRGWCPTSLTARPHSGRRRQGLEQGRAPPAAGTGPFKITKVVPRQSVSNSRATTSTGMRPASRRSIRSSCCRCRRQHPPGGAALRPGRLDRGAAAGRHPVAQAGGFT
jgi:peptide/nickel transport system substrate-binding protein